MSQPRVLIDQRSQKAGITPSPQQAWRYLGLFSWVMIAAGLGDTVLAFIPPNFGTPEWEFGTIASTFSALPLITMGLAALLASAVALGRRTQALIVAWTIIVLAVAILALFLVFLSDVPIALSQVQGEVRLGIKKAIVKTAWLGSIFALAYLVAGIGALRYLGRPRAS
jgi:hypothetical protein